MHAAGADRIRGLVGRDGELAALRAELGAVARGAARVVVIEGAAGIGKTSLLEDFLAGAGGAHVLLATGDIDEANMPFGVLEQLLAGVAAARPPVARGPVDHLAAGARLLDALGELPRDVPVVVAVDDAHWADRESLRALLFALRRLVADEVLVVLVTRDDAASALPDALRRLADGRRGRRLRLGPLSAADLQRMASGLGVTLSERAAERLREHTGGNALHSRALLAELPQALWDDAQAPWPAPRSFAALVTARLQACSPDARALAEAAAVLGAGCEREAAFRLAELDDPLDALDEAVEAGLLALDERRFQRALGFPHPLVRAAVYDAIGLARRARLHARAATLVDGEAAALRHRVAAAPGADDALAADLEAFAAREGARWAWGNMAWLLSDASRLASRREDRERLLPAAVEAYLYAGDAPAARRLARDIERLPPGPRRDSVLAYLAVASGEPPEAERRLADAWAGVTGTGDEHGLAARPGDLVAGVTGDPALAATIAQRRAYVAILDMDAPAAVEWATRAGPEDPMSAWTLALGLDLSGRHAEALAAIDAARRTAPAGRASGWPLDHSHGAILLAADDLAGARRVFEVAAPGALRHGSLVVASMCYSRLAQVCFAAGAWDEAVLHAEHALSAAVESDEDGALAFAHWAAALVPAASGRPGPSLEQLATRRLAFATHRSGGALATALTATGRGDFAAVLAALAELAAPDRPPSAEDGGHWPWQAPYADSLVALRRDDEAHAFIAREEQNAVGRGRRAMAARLARARGMLAAAEGRADHAETAFAAAAERLEPLAMPYEQALLELAHGQLLRRQGHRRVAAAILTTARERLRELGAAPALARCERELAACGLAPARRAGEPEARLTPQEREIARLVAAGLGNREIAGELMLSVKTVERHLTHVYAKLGISSRAELGDGR